MRADGAGSIDSSDVPRDNTVNNNPTGLGKAIDTGTACKPL
jgi:hypothetical protein